MKNFKKIACLLTAIVCFFNTPVLSNAKENHVVANSNIEAQLERTIEIIETDLESKNSSILNELDLAIDFLEQEKNHSSSEEETAKIQALIDTTQKLKNNYYSYSMGITPFGVSHPVYTPAVAAVATFFSSSGYWLSFELLVHAEENDVLDSTYTPYYGDRILNSPVIKQIRTSKQDVSGSASFENTGTTLEKDLYYAIHAFNYSFVNSTRVLTLTDVYDFAYGDYDGIAGAAIDTMWMAQLLGVLVPYNVVITVS